MLGSVFSEYSNTQLRSFESQRQFFEKFCDKNGSPESFLRHGRRRQRSRSHRDRGESIERELAARKAFENLPT